MIGTNVARNTAGGHQGALSLYAKSCGSLHPVIPPINATPPHENLRDFEISLIRLWIEGERNIKMGGIGNVIEEVVDLTWQINVKVDNVFVPEQQDLHNQELAIDELIEMQK
ncbi:hypothetical protein TNCV_4470241 [Trichonephila clavipes]|nr:hypothetical protein TNCV_4470241 [Trichonephila clavipes]